MLTSTPITLNPNNKDKSYIVYHVQDDKEILYIGVDNMADIVRFRRLKRFNDFDCSKDYQVFFYSIHQELITATQDLYNIIKNVANQQLPRYNKQAYLVHNAKVICCETKQVFKNAHHAAKAVRCDSGRMSSHLQKRKGHKTIRGLTFRYEEI